MKPVKSVILLTPGFPVNEDDTTCLPYLQDFVNSFSRLYPHIKLVVITFQYPYERGVYFWNGVEVYGAGGKDSKYFFRLLTWFRVTWRIQFYKKIYHATVLHSFWLTDCTLIGWWAAKLFSIKHIAYAIGQDVLAKNRYLKLLNFKKLRLAATSQFVADEFYNTTGFTIQNIIPFGVDEEKINGSDTTKTIDILGVGALTPLKNYSLFIGIVNQLKQNFPHLKSCIVGTGEQKEMLEQVIKKHRLEDNVSLTGELPHTEVFKYMAKSKLFLHTSAYEGQSTVMMEALAIGLPVVCFNVGRLQSDKITVCSDRNDMITTMEQLLLNDINFEPVVLRKSDDTARDFMKLYEH